MDVLRTLATMSEERAVFRDGSSYTDVRRCIGDYRDRESTHFARRKFRQLQAILSQHGVGGSEQRHAFLSRITKRKISSTYNVTVAETLAIIAMHKSGYLPKPILEEQDVR